MYGQKNHKLSGNVFDIIAPILFEGLEMSFDSTGLKPELLKAVKACGYKNLTPIQQKAIPAIRRGKDILASAQTGTGKTAAFALPIINSLLDKGDLTQPILRAVILTPTRELALQVADNFKQYCQHTNLKVGVVYGGVGSASQAKVLKAGVDILVATPGRLLEHLSTLHFSLGQVKHFVLDEADRMLDMGFSADIEKVIALLKPGHQTLLFSATFSHKVKLLAKSYLNSPEVIEVSKVNSTSGKVKQQVYWVEEARKAELLAELIGVNNWQQVLVFAGTRESANILAKELKLDGIKTALCHGDKSQGSRQKALQQLADGSIRVLVATDVAARGLDIESLPLVVNFHLPFLAEDYVHRVGRTGRAGKSGHAVSLVSPKDAKFMGNIEDLIGRKFDRIVQPGYEFDDSKIEKVLAKVASEKNRYKQTQDKNRRIKAKNTSVSQQSRRGNRR